MDFFRKFFGFSHNSNTFDGWKYNDEDEFERHTVPPESYPRRNFDMFSDPLQMHQYFEEEINDLLKSFGLHGFGGFFNEMPSDRPSLPELKDYYTEEQTECLRNQFLKHGYEKPTSRQSPKVDQDLDDKVKTGSLDTILGENSSPYGRNSWQEMSPYGKQHSGNIFLGQSQTMTTVTNPDGSIETEHTTRDIEGNQATTICRKLGEKEYCIIRRKDKEGREEVTEHFVNMDEREKDILFKPKNNPQIQPYKFRFENFFQ